MSVIHRSFSCQLKEMWGKIERQGGGIMDKDERKVLMELLKSCIAEKKVKMLREIFDEYNVVDMSELVTDLDLNETLFVFKTLKKEVSSELFSYLGHEKQEHLIEMLTGPEIGSILENLYSDDIVDFIEDLPANMVSHILKSVTSHKRDEINRLLSYDENTAGSIMSIDYVQLKEKDTVSKAIEKVRKQGKVAETISYCYITDSKKKLKGYLPFKELLFAKDDELIEDIMDTDLIYVETGDDQEEAARQIQKYDLTVIPVVNDEQCLVGIITVDDIIDIIHEEATEDIQLMNAITPIEDTYMETSVFAMYKSRIVWLLILMISATLTGQIMGKYEDILGQYVVLNIFIPMLMDAAGNAGNQSSTMVIRALAMGELTPKNLLSIWWKEIRVAFLCGATMGVVNFLRILIFMNSVDYRTSLIISLTVFVTVCLAKLVGSTLPVIAVKLKLDPAVMAGPLITTLVDALALLTYFTLVTHFLIPYM